MYINLPPTTGGLNARDNKGSMPATDALQLVNWIPDGETVRSRGGSVTVLAQDITTVEDNSFLTEFEDIIEQDLSGDIETLIEFDSGATSIPATDSVNGSPTFEKDNQLLICAGSKIWLYGDPPVELGSNFTSARWQYVHFKDRLILTNGIDAPQQFDGTTLNALNITSLEDSSGIATGDNATDLWGVNVFKGRVFYWTKNVSYFYYADAGSFQGALVQFDLSLQTQHGGYIVSIQTYARDSGSGLDDYIVFYFSTGETLVYQGDDPSNVNSWSLVNKYQLAPPVDIRGFQQLGGDVLSLTIDGWQNLSASLPNQRLTNQNQLGEKIINIAKREVENNSSKFGWGILYYAKGSLIIINIPRNKTTSRQHIQNTKTGAWTTFVNWNAKCFCIFNDNLYFADEFGNLRKADYGTSDNGQFIKCKVRPAFQNFGNGSLRKQINGAQVITNYRYPKHISLDVNKDFNKKRGKPLTYPPENELFTWNKSNWNEDYWDNGQDYDSNIVKPPYKMVFGWGYALSIQMRLASRTQKVTWYGTNINLKKLGSR